MTQPCLVLLKVENAQNTMIFNKNSDSGRKISD